MHFIYMFWINDSYIIYNSYLVLLYITISSSSRTQGAYLPSARRHTSPRTGAMCGQIAHAACATARVKGGSQPPLQGTNMPRTELRVEDTSNPVTKLAPTRI